MIHCQQALPPREEKTGAFSNSSAGFRRHRESGDGSLVSLCVFSDLMERCPDSAFRHRKNRSDVFFQLRNQRRGRGTPTGGSALQSTRQHLTDVYVFFHRLDCHQQLTDVIAAANTSRRQQPRGKWVVRGTPQGATSLEMRCYNYSNSADT